MLPLSEALGSSDRPAALLCTIQTRLEQLRQEELNRYCKHASAAESQLLDEATRSLLQHVLAQHLRALEAAQQRDAAEPLCALLGAVFGLSA